MPDQDERPQSPDSVERRGTLAGYQVLKGLGKGGMGTVYLARQESLDREVAIKVLSSRMMADPEYVARFLSEAKAVARLNHPNIVAALDAGEDQGRFYFVMEYVRGPSLAQVIAQDGPLSNERLAAVARDIAAALGHAHEAGIVHRDVKPQNILLAPDGAAKLCDLGLALNTAAGSDYGRRDGSPMGTPYYIAPEQARGDRDLDGRTDLYSLGATLFHAATGEPPFTGPTPMVIMSAHLTQEPVPPRKKNPKLSPSLERVILKLLAKKREDRYADAQALLDDLSDGADKKPLAKKRGRGKSAARALAARGSNRAGVHPGVLALGGALLVLGGALVWYSAYGTLCPGGPWCAVPENQSEDDAQAALRAVMQYETDHPEDFQELLIRIDRVVAEHPGTHILEAAENYKKQVRERWEVWKKKRGEE